jgi:hypothetical protein
MKMTRDDISMAIQESYGYDSCNEILHHTVKLLEHMFKTIITKEQEDEIRDMINEYTAHKEGL